MARVDVVREVKTGDVGERQLCLHWCRYRDSSSVTYGYRFVATGQGREHSSGKRADANPKLRMR
jgi:hypothetical protein